MIGVRLISTGSCETIYDVGGVIVRLFIITGGTPGLSFEDHSFLMRFPKVDRWSDENWIKEEVRYVHQDPNNKIGPTHSVLPNGEQDMIDYVRRFTKIKKAREARGKVVSTYDEMTSPFFTDPTTGDQCFVSFNFSPSHIWVLKISGRSEVLGLGLPKEWEALELVLSEIKGDSVEELSDAEYWELIRCLERCSATARSFRPPKL